jgi:hypothetical protein
MSPSIPKNLVSFKKIVCKPIGSKWMVKIQQDHIFCMWLS